MCEGNFWKSREADCHWARQSRASSSGKDPQEIVGLSSRILQHLGEQLQEGLVSRLPLDEAARTSATAKDFPDVVGHSIRILQHLCAYRKFIWRTIDIQTQATASGYRKIRNANWSILGRL